MGSEQQRLEKQHDQADRHHGQRPNSRAPKPTPVGCEWLPVTEGSLSADRGQKENAAATPSSMRCSGCSFSCRRTEHRPRATKGAAAMLQPSACSTGRRNHDVHDFSRSDWNHRGMRIGGETGRGNQKTKEKPGRTSLQTVPVTPENGTTTFCRPVFWLAVDLLCAFPCEHSGECGVVPRLTAAGAAPEWSLTRSPASRFTLPCTAGSGTRKM